MEAEKLVASLKEQREKVMADFFEFERAGKKEGAQIAALISATLTHVIEAVERIA